MAVRRTRRVWRAARLREGCGESLGHATDAGAGVGKAGRRRLYLRPSIERCSPKSDPDASRGSEWYPLMVPMTILGAAHRLIRCQNLLNLHICRLCVESG